MQSESRRDFFGSLLVAIGGIAATAVTTVGCAAPTRDPDLPSAEGPAEQVPLGPGNYYANTMPDHVAAVRQNGAVGSPSDASGSKRFE
jgi:hypothetical protein